MCTRLIFKCVLILKPLPLSGEVYSELVDDADGTFTVKALDSDATNAKSRQRYTAHSNEGVSLTALRNTFLS